MSGMETSSLTVEFMRKMFSEGKRFDSRNLLDYRDFEISFEVSNCAEGSARIKLGKTDVVVGVKMAPGEPYPDSPDAGNLMVSGDLLPLASPRFESGPPGFTAIELPRLVDRAIRESHIIDLSKLVITAGEKVWTVFIDIYPINDDGNLIDAACIAAVAALKNTFVPALDKEGHVDYSKKSDTKLPITKEIPISFTFYKLGDALIMDPTREEEEACEVKIVFGVSKNSKDYMINSCQKSGPITFSEEEIGKMMDLLPKKFDDINKKLKKYIKE